MCAPLKEIREYLKYLTKNEELHTLNYILTIWKFQTILMLRGFISLTCELIRRLLFYDCVHLEAI